MVDHGDGLGGVFEASPAAWAEVALRWPLDAWQASVLEASGQWMLLNCCRQSGKSTTAALKALHRAMFVDESLILLISPSLRQSQELKRKIDWAVGRLEEPPQMPEASTTSCRFANGSRIVCLPSTEATVRGYSGASLIIEDEASRVPDELYHAIRPMLAVSGGGLLLMSTPFGKRGHFWDAWDRGEGWDRVRIPALECPRITPEFLERERSEVPEFWFRQEYECEFAESTDQVFRYDQVMAALDTDVQPLFAEPGDDDPADDAVEPLLALVSAT